MARTNQNKMDLRTQLEALKTVRDELRVQAHLGGIEAREAWSRIEPQFDALEREAVQAGFITVRAAGHVFHALGQFVAALVREATRERPAPEAHP